LENEKLYGITKEGVINKMYDKKYLRNIKTSDKVDEKAKKYRIDSLKPDEFLKERMVIRFFLFGVSKDWICKKLQISEYKFEQWIKKCCENKKETAIKMYFYGCSKDKICKELKIALIRLNTWIDELYEKREFYERTSIQSGFSTWVSEIIKKYMQAS
jgi:transposase